MIIIYSPSSICIPIFYIFLRFIKVNVKKTKFFLGKDSKNAAFIDRNANKYTFLEMIDNILVITLHQKLLLCPEMTVFVKTYLDATSVSIRLVRAYTKRTKIIPYCYPGWHVWCIEVKSSVPEKRYEDVYEFQYNNLNSRDVRTGFRLRSGETQKYYDVM